MWIKTLHLMTVAFSGSFFLLRFYWMIKDSVWLQKKWVKIVPHVNDTVLLVSAIVLAVQLHLSPSQHGWLLAKIIALVVYIVLGTLALKRAPTRQWRIITGLLAILVFVYIVMVAINKTPFI